MDWFGFVLYCPSNGCYNINLDDIVNTSTFDHTKPTCIALIYGAIAGAIAALTLALMTGIQHHLWASDWANTPAGIASIIMLGGGLLALLHHYYHLKPTHQGLSEELRPVHNPKTLVFLALSAIIAVAFGGAIGPEAGLLAVVAECSVIIGSLLKDSYTKQIVYQTGTLASLSGLYGAPPAAIALDDTSDDNTQSQAVHTTPSIPLAVKPIAGLSGTMGFWAVHQQLSDQDFSQLPIAEHTAQFGDLWLALPAILSGALAGVLFLLVHHAAPKLLNQLSSSSTIQILIGSAIFALIASIVPLVRFSGHHEIEHALSHGVHGDVSFFVMLVLAKIVAMAICLASGWRGGEFFPAIFIGFAVAYAINILCPSIPLTVAIMGAIGSVVVVCMGKPVAALLILLLLAGIQAPTALIGGVVFGAIIRQFTLRLMPSLAH